ncbi:MAG: amino acid kinase [Candidatus Methanoperedens sp.]|nr:amino acid kinase [Candidatus Methanoperedens sp.]MCZ7384255.1 amino acid kinase [Candidatus Methanoperedens sp.]MCZ7403421.1 amino acid kinase [Candidatus Methanoperedens sp.]
MIVIKIGGSLIQRGRELVREIIEYSKSEDETILIVPGGSIFADTVRKINATEEAAHWMAVLAMEQYGYYLGNGNDVKFIDNLDIHGKGGFILLPYNLLKTKDELPHTWDVTSDTIAAWVARKLRARFIKATDVDGIYLDGTLQKELEASELVGKETCVDAYLSHFLMENKMDCEIINGNCPGRVKTALKSNVIGTLIKG